MTRSVRRRWTSVALVAVAALGFGAPRAHAAVGDAFLDGCLNAGTAMAPCTSGPGLSGAYREKLSPDGKQLYVAVAGGGADSAALLIYDRDPATGKLARRADHGCVTPTGSSGACLTAPQLGNPQDIAISPDGTNVYVSNAETNTIIELRRAADGSLTVMSQCVGNATGCTAVTGMGVAHALAIPPDGRSVYLRTDGGISGTGTLLVFDRAADGTLTQKPAGAGCWSETAQTGCTVGAGISHQSWQIAATNTNVYATGWNDSYTWYAYGCYAPPINYICGFYFGNTAPSTGSIAVFGRSADGTLSQEGGVDGCISNTGGSGGAGSVFGTPSTPPPTRCRIGSEALDHARGVTLSPDGKSLYVATLSGIVSYARATDGTLTEIGCLQKPGSAKPGCTDADGLGENYRIAVTPSGTDLLTTWGTRDPDGGVAFLRRDPATGVLSQRTGTKRCLTHDGTGGACETLAPLGGLGDVVVSPDSGFAYLASQANGVLATLHRDVAPRCQDRTVSVPYQTSVVVPLTCTDVNGDALTLAITRQPTNGTLAGAIDAQAKTIRYSPPLGYSGTDGFDYAATGQGVQSAPAHVTLQVQPPASPPPSGGDDGGETGGGGTGTQAGRGAPASHRKARRMPATPAAAWKVKGTKFTLTKLTIKRLPRGWSVKATCKGKKCPFKSKALKNRKMKKGTLNALKLLGSKHVFRAGQTLELRISAKGYKTKVVRYALKKGKHPKAMTTTS